MIRKEFANIGKFMLRQISSWIEVYHEVQDSVTSESSLLDSSSLRFQVIKKRLSKSQILQFIYYHFLPLDERGVVLSVSEKEVAEAIGCNIRTVRNNNLVLEDARLILHSRSGKGINVWILSYPEYFQEGGSGYLPMEFSRFQEWVTIENVNALRMELRKELVYDNNTVKRLYQKEDTSVISMNDMKLFLPKYTHYRGKIEEIVRKGSSAYDTIVSDSSILFTIQPGYTSGKTAKEKKKEEYRQTIDQTLHAIVEGPYLTEFTKKDIEDFIQLAFEYGIARVIEGLKALNSEMFSNDQIIYIHNMGGKLRAIIRIQISQYAQFQALSSVTA